MLHMATTKTPINLTGAARIKEQAISPEGIMQSQKSSKRNLTDSNGHALCFHKRVSFLFSLKSPTLDGNWSVAHSRWVKLICVKKGNVDKCSTSL